VRVQTKPAWVLHEVLRLKALMPAAGCRRIADVFNRRFAPTASVSKSFVAYSVRAHRYEIEVLRRRLKCRKPAPQSRNQIWAMDMTGKTDAHGVLHMALGIFDHGSRRLLGLDVLFNKNAWTLLGHLFLAIGRYGKPIAVRTDNEACFVCRLFCGGLRLAGIRHQRTVPGCPWMNGRIERLFGTFKDKLRGIVPVNGAAFSPMLREFLYWYNAVRPHQNLGGLTPLEAWNGLHRPESRTDWPPWFEAWGGRLVGFDWQR
jgi:putative transposase